MALSFAKRIVFIGPPGSGKGTYAKHLAPIVSAAHVSVGDLVRSQISQDTPLGRDLATRSRLGQLVPDATIFQILNSTLVDSSSSFILDGFPRTLAQAEHLEAVSFIDRVVIISMRPDMLIRKSIGRRVCPDCHKSFNLAHIDESDFYMPAILPAHPDCIVRRCEDRFIQREVRLYFI